MVILGIIGGFQFADGGFDLHFFRRIEFFPGIVLFGFVDGDEDRVRVYPGLGYLDGFRSSSAWSIDS